MTKKSKKRGRPRASGPSAKPSGEASPAKVSSEAKPLDERPRKREPKPVKLSAKEQSALAKKAARARLLKSA
jgi:hypothetical protein